LTATRRQLLIRGAGSAGALAVPATLLNAAPAFASSDSDALTALCKLEQASSLGYKTAIDSGALDAATAKQLEIYAEQEGEHSTAWKAALDQLGADLPATPTNPADVPELEGIEDLDTQDDLLDFLAELEQTLADRYTEESASLTIDDLIRTGAQIVANHAQHLVALRDLRGDDLADLTAG
jgi:rubrerythrin